MLVMTLCWCIAAGRVIYFQGDNMIGFHPLVLLLLPFGGCLGLAVLIGCVMRKWRFAAMAAISVIMVAAFFGQAYRIGELAWTRSIRQYDAVNQEVIRKSTGLPELTDDTMAQGLWADNAIPVLKGFGWYCEHHLASPGGTFRAFRYRGVVHVRIQKIRHGYRGVALVNSPADKERMEKAPSLIYENERPIGEHWFIWRSD